MLSHQLLINKLPLMVLHLSLLDVNLNVFVPTVNLNGGKWIAKWISKEE